MCEQRNCRLWLLIWQPLVAKNSQVCAACVSEVLSIQNQDKVGDAAHHLIDIYKYS